MPKRPTEETRKKLSRSLKAWWTGPRRREQARRVKAHWMEHPELLGTRGPKRPEVVARAAAALRARWADPEFRAMMSAAMRRGWTTKARRRLARAKMGRALPDATRRRMSESALARWARRREGASDAAPGAPDAATPREHAIARGHTGGPGGGVIP